MATPKVLPQPRHLNAAPEGSSLSADLTWKPLHGMRGNAASKQMIRALRIDAAVGCQLQQMPSSDVETVGLDDRGWRRAAKLVGENGGQLMFGLVFYESEHAIKGEARVVWFDSAQAVIWNVWGNELGTFYPDAATMNAFRSTGVAPSDWVLWK